MVSVQMSVEYLQLSDDVWNPDSGHSTGDNHQRRRDEPEQGYKGRGGGLSGIPGHRTYRSTKNMDDRCVHTFAGSHVIKYAGDVTLSVYEAGIQLSDLSEPFGDKRIYQFSLDDRKWCHGNTAADICRKRNQYMDSGPCIRGLVCGKHHRRADTV